MIIVCADEHTLMCRGLVGYAEAAMPGACVHGFTDAQAAIDFVRQNGCDVLLCEVELYTQSGRMLADELQRLHPQINIIFITVCDEKEHAREVLALKPSAYLTKPVSRQQIARELSNLRYPVK